MYFYSVIADAVHNYCHDIYDQSPTVVFPCIPRNFPFIQGGSVDLEQQYLQMYSFSARQVTLLFNNYILETTICLNYVQEINFYPTVELCLQHQINYFIGK